MKQFIVKPAIYQIATCEEFANHFQLGKDDLIITNEYIYVPSFGSMSLACHVVYLEKYGTGEPSDEMVEAIYRDIPKNYRRVIGIGGGGVLDVTKVLALKYISPVLALYDGKHEIIKDKELILIPTTCGTGSEVTNISILALSSRGTKKGLATNELFANSAVLIPELLNALPFRFFATSSIDALIHGVESTLSPKASQTTKLFGYKAIDMILRGFMDIRDHGPEARIPLLEQFLIASNYAGIAFGNAGCGAVHALSYPLGAVYHVPHGEANYAMFTGVMNKYLSIKSDGELACLNAFIADILHCDISCVYEEMETLLNVLIPKKTLREYGMSEADLHTFTDSVRDNQQRLMANNFVPLSDEQVYDIYRTLY